MKPRLYTLPFLLISTANLFNVASFGFFYIFPLFITSCHGTKSDIGIIMGATAFSSVFCRPWISEMVDRLGRKKSYTIGCIIMTILPVFYLFFHGDIKSIYMPLIIIRLVYGVGLAICFTAVFTYIADITPKERLNEGIGMFGATGLLGLAIGPVLAEIIVKNWGFNLFFTGASIIAGIGFVLEIFLPESYSAKQKILNEISFLSLLRVKKIFLISLIALCFGIGLAATGNFVSPFMQQRGINFISAYYISYSSAAILTRLLGGRLADTLGEEKIIPYGLIIFAFGLIIIIFAKNELLLCTSGLISGCGHGLLFPCLNSLIIKDKSISIRGKLTGLFTGSIDTGGFMGSIILGYIGDLFGFKILFFSSALIILPWFIVFKVSYKYQCGSKEICL